MVAMDVPSQLYICVKRMHFEIKSIGYFCLAASPCMPLGEGRSYLRTLTGIHLVQRGTGTIEHYDKRHSE